MVPPEYSSYFSAMAAVGATLFGLIFVAISIVPESVTTANASVERQVRAATSYIALLNPLVISLFALIPHQQIGVVAIGMGLLGLLNTLGIALTVIRSAGPSGTRIRHSLFILGGFFLYGYECYFAIRLIKSPADNVSLYFLADLLIMISIFGVIRAWELIGMRQFHLLNWISSVRITKDSENQFNQDSASKETNRNEEKPPDITKRPTG
jgi:hypothetical protein